MVIAQFWDEVKKELIQYYFDGKLYIKLNEVKKRMTKKDFDYVCIVDGGEGTGKSVFSMQLCKYIDPSFSIERVCFTPEEFKQQLLSCPPKSAVLYDEAFTGLSSRASLSEINHMLNSLIMQIRQKNLFIVITLPTIFLLDKYVSMFRAKALFHVYLGRGERGFFRVYGTKTKQKLILNGRRAYDYKAAKSKFKGRFTDYYTVPEETYRTKKALVLSGEKKRTPLTEKHKIQRDALIKLLYKKYKVPFLQMERELANLGVQLPDSTLQRAAKDFKTPQRDSQPTV